MENYQILFKGTHYDSETVLLTPEDLHCLDKRRL